MEIQETGAEQEMVLTTLDSNEKEVLRRILRLFRRWYAGISVKELGLNQMLTREINAFEGIFRAAMM